MRFLAIVLLSILAACVYGIVHDQVTARICVEYFTIGHPPLIDSDSPTLLGLAWGGVATWWVGLFLGIGLGVASQAGSKPDLPIQALLRPIGMLLGVTGLCATLGGIAGYLLAEQGIIWLVKPLYGQVPRERHALFLADLWAHSASYLVGIVGGGVVMVYVWRSHRAIG